MATKIYSDNGLLSFDGDEEKLATAEEYEMGDRCVGSIFEALESGEVIELEEGFFTLDEDLDLIK